MTIEKRRPKKEADNMAVKLQPLADRVVVKPVAKEEKTKSGIYIPDTAKCQYASNGSYAGYLGLLCPDRIWLCSGR